MITSSIFPVLLDNREIDYFEDCTRETFEQYLEMHFNIPEETFNKVILIPNMFNKRQVCIYDFYDIKKLDIEPFWKIAYYTSRLRAHKRKRITPFSLKLEEFIALPYNEIKELYSQVNKLYKDSLEEAWARGIRHLIICNKKIVLESNKLPHISDEEIKELSKKHNTACYVFSAPDFVEESSWHNCQIPDPPYPTIPIYIGQSDAGEDEIIRDNPPIITDFDTGTPDLKCFSSAIMNPRIIEGEKIYRFGEHLKREYLFFLRFIKLCIEDINNNVNSKNYEIILVEEWDEDCALRQASPNRLGLIGRDVLFDLGVKIILDSRNGQTTILEVT